MQSFKERLEKAVRHGELSLNIPLDSGEATKMKKLIATNISARGAFDFMCHPYTTTPVIKKSTAITSEILKTQQTTPYGGSTSATTSGNEKCSCRYIGTIDLPKMSFIFLNKHTQKPINHLQINSPPNLYYCDYATYQDSSPSSM